MKCAGDNSNSRANFSVNSNNILHFTNVMSITSIFLFLLRKIGVRKKSTCNIIVINISEHLLKNFSWPETDKKEISESHTYYDRSFVVLCFEIVLLNQGYSGTHNSPIPASWLLKLEIWATIYTLIILFWIFWLQLFLCVGSYY